MNWLGVFKKACANVDFIFRPRIVTAVIPKYVLSEHLKIVSVAEDLNNVYITFEKSENKNVAIS